MATIEILVRNKIARQTHPRLPMVCGNSDYIIKFNFDSEWDEFENKIAVFKFKKDEKWENIPVLFDGTEVAAPILRGVTAVFVGCTAGDVRTTTPAAIACLASVTDSAGTEAPPPEDIWGQILDKLGSIGGAADGTLGITGATVGQMPQISAVDDDGKPTAWTAADAPQGDGMYWAKVADFETTDETNEIYVDKDDSGVPFADYNAVAELVSFYIPADSTQASSAGSIWAYPLSSFETAARTIIPVASWKTTSRTISEVFLGDKEGYVAAGATPMGSANVFSAVSGRFDALRLFLNSAGDHFPAGTKVRIFLLTGVRK